MKPEARGQYHAVCNKQDLLHEFLTMSRLKISTIRFDGASEFGKSSSFIEGSASICTCVLVKQVI
jgi:hypothetical protein